MTYETDMNNELYHDDVIKLKHFPRYWAFVRGIHRPPAFVCACINEWVNNREAGDLGAIAVIMTSL